MPHDRARYTPLGRWEVVRCVVEVGQTVWEWVNRWRAAAPEDRESLACLAERSSRPKTGPARIPADEEARICELRRRTG